jgi:6-phosphofructokinase
VLILKAEGVGVATARIKQELDARVGSERTDSRVTVLGHVVRGGVPTCFDRMLGARLGHAAVYEMQHSAEPFMAGWSGPGTSGRASMYDPHVTLTPLATVLEQTAQLVRGEGPLASWRRDAYRHAERALAP